MKKLKMFALVVAGVTIFASAFGAAEDQDMPGVAPEPAGGWKTKAICISVPAPKDVGRFCTFVKDTLKPAGVDTVVLLVRYKYQFTSHPGCVTKDAISLDDAKAIKRACDDAGIRLVPKMNLLGHQSGNTISDGLLKAYPELDESPEKKNVRNNYCRSICPKHPDSMRIVTDLADELVEAFGADALHIGCDEVFEIGNCPRCKDTPTSKLFADWVNGIARHLKSRGVDTMIWGDRLLDAKTTGYGEWEASDNGTSDAVNMLDKDIAICDWHYENCPAYPSVDVFADAGRKIYLCPWRYSENTQKFLAYAVAHDRGQYLGLIFTTWSSCKDVMDVLEGKGVPRHEPGSKAEKTLLSLRRNFRYLFPKAKNVSAGKQAASVDATTSGSRVRGGDPFIHLENGTYYLYCSFRDSEGLVVHTSEDLKEWKPYQGRGKGGFAYVKGNGFGSRQFWAPEMHKYMGKYYLFHSAEEKVAVAVSDSPLGPFQNKEKEPFFKEGNIDNSLFVDDDGTPYMLYAHFHAGNEVWICELEKDLMHAKAETQRKLIRAEEDWEMNRSNPKYAEYSIAEGPCLVKVDGLYYLTYSSHHVIDPEYNVCLATAPSIKGPWTKQGKGPILAPRGKLECTGHHSLFKDKSGNWKIVFHARDPGSFERYVYTADAKFVTKDGHPWIDVGEFQPCLLVSDPAPSATRVDATARPEKWAVPMTCAGVPNLHKVSDKLYRSAQPTAEGMTNLVALGIKTVVNLRDNHSDSDEIGALPLKAHRIEIFTGNMKDKYITDFLSVLDDTNAVPVLVHCQHGADRTGTMCAMYRILREGWTADEAIAEMKNGGYGYHSVWGNLPRFIRKASERMKQPENVGRSGVGEGVDAVKKTGPDVLTAISTRKSIRKFDASKPVEDDKVEKMLRAAMCAPTAMDKRPWEFVVVKDPAKLSALAARLPYSRVGNGAKLAIVVCGSLDNGLPGRGKEYWIHDCSAATMNLLLAAHAQGLGAVWTGVFPGEDRIAAVREILSIPDGYMPLNVIPVGYPAENPPVKDKWNPAKIHYDKW